MQNLHVAKSSTASRTCIPSVETLGEQAEANVISYFRRPKRLLYTDYN